MQNHPSFSHAVHSGETITLKGATVFSKRQRRHVTCGAGETRRKQSKEDLPLQYWQEVQLRQALEKGRKKVEVKPRQTVQRTYNASSKLFDPASELIVQEGLNIEYHSSLLDCLSPQLNGSEVLQMTLDAQLADQPALSRHKIGKAKSFAMAQRTTGSKHGYQVGPGVLNPTQASAGIEQKVLHCISALYKILIASSSLSMDGWMHPSSKKSSAQLQIVDGACVWKILCPPPSKAHDLVSCNEGFQKSSNRLTSPGQ